MGVENYIWNQVRIWGTGRHTPTKNSQEYPLLRGGMGTAHSYTLIQSSSFVWLAAFRLVPVLRVQLNRSITSSVSILLRFPQHHISFCYISNIPERNNIYLGDKLSFFVLFYQINTKPLANGDETINLSSSSEFSSRTRTFFISFMEAILPQRGPKV